jgi:hypothetical protein
VERAEAFISEQGLPDLQVRAQGFNPRMTRLPRSSLLLQTQLRPCQLSHTRGPCCTLTQTPAFLLGTTGGTLPRLALCYAFECACALDLAAGPSMHI